MKSLHGYTLEIEQTFPMINFMASYFVIKDKEGNVVDKTRYDWIPIDYEWISLWHEPKTHKEAIAHNQAEHKRIKKWLASYGIYLNKEG